MKPIFALLLLACILAGNISLAQTQPPYKLPDSYRFDYEVTQAIVCKKNISDTSVMHFFYTKSGDYAAAMISGKANRKGNLFVVITQDGHSIIFDEHSKNITVVSIRKLMSDFYSAAKWIRMDSLMASLHKQTDGKHVQSVKTGKTQMVNKYTSEEYIVSDSIGHQASVWCAKVDFNTLPDFILSATGGNILKMMGGRSGGHPLFQALIQPKTMVTAIKLRDSADRIVMDMHTVSINQIATTISTGGYPVNDYSNMTLMEIFGAEMRKRNN